MFGINPMQNPMGYQPSAPPPSYQPPFIGQWRVANSYQEVLTIPVPANGAPVIVTLADEPVLYVLHMEGGQKMISCFSITPLPGAAPAQETPQQNQSASMESRMENLEKTLRQLCASLGEGIQHESNPASPSA